MSNSHIVALDTFKSAIEKSSFESKATGFKRNIQIAGHFFSSRANFVYPLGDAVVDTISDLARLTLRTVGLGLGVVVGGGICDRDACTRWLLTVKHLGRDALLIPTNLVGFVRPVWAEKLYCGKEGKIHDVGVDSFKYALGKIPFESTEKGLKKALGQVGHFVSTRANFVNPLLDGVVDTITDVARLALQGATFTIGSFVGSGFFRADLRDRSVNTLKHMGRDAYIVAKSIVGLVQPTWAKKLDTCSTPKEKAKIALDKAKVTLEDLEKALGDAKDADAKKAVQDKLDATKKSVVQKEAAYKKEVIKENLEIAKKQEIETKEAEAKIEKELKDKVAALDAARKAEQDAKDADAKKVAADKKKILEDEKRNLETKAADAQAKRELATNALTEANKDASLIAALEKEKKALEAAEQNLAKLEEKASGPCEKSLIDSARQDATTAKNRVEVAVNTLASSIVKEATVASTKPKRVARTEGI